MEEAEIVDVVLEELLSTRYPSISISRVLKKRNIGISEDRIASVENILLKKSIVEERSQDSHGDAAYSLTGTGQDFIKTFGSYSKYKKGIEKEKGIVGRADGEENVKDHPKDNPVAMNRKSIEAVDMVLKELGGTEAPSMSVGRILKKHDLICTDETILAIESTLLGKSLVRPDRKSSDGSTTYTIEETGLDFIRTFGSYSEFLTGIEKKKIRIDRVTKRTSDRTERSAQVKEDKRNYTAQKAILKKEDGKTVDIVLKKLEVTSHSSLSVSRILKNEGIQFTDELILAIEQVLTSRSLVTEMGINSAGNRVFALAETGQDFIRSFGSYSGFLKGVEKENRKLERARNKKPYNTKTKQGSESITKYANQKRNFFSRRLKNWTVMLFVALIIYLISQSKWMGV